MIPSLFFSPFSSLLSLSHSALSLFLSHFCLTPSFPLSLSLSPFPSLFVCFPSPPINSLSIPPPQSLPLLSLPSSLPSSLPPSPVLSLPRPLPLPLPLPLEVQTLGREGAPPDRAPPASVHLSASLRAPPSRAPPSHTPRCASFHVPPRACPPWAWAQGAAEVRACVIGTPATCARTSALAGSFAAARHTFPCAHLRAHLHPHLSALHCAHNMPHLCAPLNAEHLHAPHRTTPHVQSKTRDLPNVRCIHGMGRGEPSCG